jgi:hypothetical protein
MHGTFERSRKSSNRIERGSGIVFLALPAFLVLALIGLAFMYPETPILISQAVQAEFVGIELAPDLAPTQLAQPRMLARTIRTF